MSILAVPGFVGAFIGATALSNLDAAIAKPIVATILLSLGVYVIYRFLRLGGRRPQFKARPSAGFLAPMGLVAGALDAVGGGGWGPVGTTSLLSSGRLEPRKVVGSIDTSEFVVAVGGSLGFILALGSQGINWGYAGALLAGGIVAAPIAAWLVKHLAARVLGVAAGGLIVLTNTKTVLESLGASGRGRGPRRGGHLHPLGDRHRLGGQAGAPRPGARRRGASPGARDGLSGVRRGDTGRRPRGQRGVCWADMSDKLLPCASPPRPTTPSGR